MTETSTVQVTCRDCDTMITKPGHGPGCKRRLCDPCKLAAQQRNVREYMRRRRTKEEAQRPPRVCLDCPTAIDEMGPKALRCIPCRNAKNRAYQKLLRDARPRVEREFFCIVCEAKIERVGNSGKPLYCPTDAAEAHRANRSRMNAKKKIAYGSVPQTHCHYCGIRFETPRQRGRTPARCEECKRQKLYAYKRSLTTQGRGTSAPCPDCNKPVPIKRKGRKAVRCADCRVVHNRKVWVEHGRVHNHRRRAWKLGRPSERFSSTEIFIRDNWRCGICNGKIRKSLRHPHPMSASLDHKIPLSRGGAHLRENSQASHLRCNLRKNAELVPIGGQIPLFV